MEIKTIVGLVYLLTVLILPLTNAFSVSPAKFDVGGDEENTFVFTLRNEEPTSVSVSFEGELAPYATANQTLIMVDETRRVSVQVDPPELTEGPHKLLIVFRTDESKGQVGSATELVPFVRYTKPYTDAFLEYSLGVQDARDPVQLTLMLSNIGAKDTVITPLFFFDETPYEQKSVLLEQGLTERVLYTLPKTVYAPGAYNLTVQLTSSEKPEVNDKEETIRVLLGVPEFSIRRITTAGNPGGVVRVIADVSSNWNEPITATIAAKIGGDTGEWLLQPQTTVLDTATSLTLFWESSGAENGVYELTLTVNALGETSTLIQEFILEQQTLLDTPESKWWLLVLVILLLGVTAYVLLFKNK